MTDKITTVNYTDALTKTIVEAYNKEPTLENAKKIAVENNRTLKWLLRYCLNPYVHYTAFEKKVKLFFIYFSILF